MAIEATGWSTDAVTRLFAGVSIGSRSGRLKVALVHCRGEGWSLRCHEVEAMTMPPPEPDTASLAEAICHGLAAITSRARIPLSAIDVLGLARLPEDRAVPLVASIVAEQTGITVVSNFDVTDRACGGRGGPLSPLADWFLFRSARQRRLLIQLGSSLRVTLIGPGEMPANILCFDAAPCGDFLDGLCQDLSQGKYDLDPSGHFAVQGTVSEPLVEQWLSHPYLLRPPPKILAPTDFGKELRQTSIHFAKENHLSARDILCSANHFVIRAFREAIHRFLPIGKPIDEVWVSGGGSWNGLLWKLLHESLDPIPVNRSDDIGIPSEARRPVHVALLAYFAMEYLPGNLPAITGARQARVLGQITPGSAENWDRWVLNLSDRFDLHERQAA